MIANKSSTPLIRDQNMPEKRDTYMRHIARNN